MFQRLARYLKMRTNRATLSEDGQDTTESNISDLGRLLVKNSLQHIVRDTESGRYLVTVLRNMFGSKGS